ncbi:serine/threonine protein kinase [Myxococcota bacterium]
MSQTNAPQVNQFGDYLLLRKVASGGMAEIHQAELVGVGGFRREVAIKRIHPQHSDEYEFIAQLLDEARIAAKLVHPNIAQVLNCGCLEGTYFIAMEYVDGQTLKQLHKRLATRGKRLPAAASLHIGVMLCRALGYAHKLSENGEPLNIIHRDVSTNNVMITYSGEVKLVDFGVARAINKLHRTETGLVRGTMAYMAPEHLAGETIDHRADQYAASLVLFEMFTASRAYVAPSHSQLIRCVLEGEVADFDGRLATAKVPAAIAEVLKRGLSFRREQRFADCDELARELSKVEVATGYDMDQLGDLLTELFSTEQEEASRELKAIRETSQEWAVAGPDAPTVPICTNADRSDTQATRRRKFKLVLGPMLATLVLAAAIVGWFLLRTTTNDLKVVTEPSGATITVNGVEQPGTTPILIEQLEVGAQITVGAELAGYKSLLVRYNVTHDFRQLKLELETHKVTLEIVGAAPGASIIVANEPVGRADADGRLETRILPGNIEVQVEARGRDTFETQVSLKPGEDLRLTVPVLRDEGRRGPTDGASPSKTGILEVACMPWCEISIDGKSVGKQSPLRNYRLPAGEHLIEVLNPPSGRRESAKVTVKPGETNQQYFRLDHR